MNEYKVTIIIESNEEELSSEFWVEAESFEKAVHNLEEELDVCL